MPGRATVPSATEFLYRGAPEDFVVDELLPARALLPAPTNDAEHLWLRIMKRGKSTTFVADALAEHFGVPAVDVSYAGRKDRVAVTSQWFSVRCATRSAAGPAFRAPACRVLEQHWAARKLRRADHRANAFVLTLHCAPDTDAAQRLGRLAAAPVLPNYFGPQRFSAGTVAELAQELARRTAATPWPKRRRRLSPQQSWLASVCRSFLFNEMLALQMRTQQCDANAMAATLPLLGSDRDLRPQAPAVAAVVAQYEHIASWLQRGHVRQSDRPAVVRVANLAWCLDQPGATGWRNARLRFELPAGAYATNVLASLGECWVPGDAASGPRWPTTPLSRLEEAVDGV